MNHVKFMLGVIEVYGPYNSEILESLTMSYLQERWRESDLESVYKQLILKKSSKYKTPPDPAEFEELFPRQSSTSIEAEALKWWDELNRKINSYRDCIISDVRAYKAIQMMGGWTWFCQRLVRDETGKDIDVWNRKQFVEYFKLYSENRPDEEISIMQGLSEMKKPPVMIGNQEQCLMIQEKSNNAITLVEDMTNTIRERTA